MDRNAMAQLRLDRRLIKRRGWISGEALERELEQLPDVSHKAAPQDESGAPRPAAEPEPSERAGQG